VAELSATWFEELSELLRIPSISADPERKDDVRRAAGWVAEYVDRMGGSAELVETPTFPLAVGEVRASSGADSAPTVLCYGHFDVQPPAPLDQWESEPFEPTVRDGWLYGRGTADDKGQLWALLKAAEELVAAGELPVNVRFVCDGEEETGGHQVVEFIEADERGADAAVIFDGAMLRRGAPIFYVATRGLVYFHVRVRTGERDLHSGVFGGAALSATHALMQALRGVVAEDGLPPEPLRAGVAAPTDEEFAAWRELDPGSELLAEGGARPADARAAEEFYVRTWAEPAVDVNGFVGGEPNLQKTVLPVTAEANVSIRLAPGQHPDEIAPVFTRLVQEAAPDGAEVEIERWSSAPPGLIPPDAPAIRLAQDAFERVVGTRPLLIRVGGTLPIVPALADKGIATVLSGFDLPEGNIHSPNERLLVEHIPLAVETAKELFRAFAELPRG
jgi:acetylornithine deacetylase/succinyl-diaminopimelate desuccinylase-like protein